MDLRIITAGELQSFVETSSFAQLDNVPISPLRALAQHKNPAAEFDDPVLFIAFDDDGQVLSYFGCLPDRLRNVESEKICWSSCWWAHPQKGKASVMAVFYKALQSWEGKMLFDALPDRSKKVLEQMRFFSFREIKGIHAFIKFKFHKIIPARYPYLSAFKTIFYGVDYLLNLPTQVFHYIWKQGHILPDDIRVISINKIDERTQKFIDSLANYDLVKRSMEQFNWILEYPWLSNSKEFSKRYYFSSYASIFQNNLYQVYKNDQLIALLWITNRDGTAKLPFCYVMPGFESIAVQVIFHQIIHLEVDTFICFQENILNAIKDSSTPTLYQRSIKKVLGWSEKLKHHLEAPVYVQDGDGDVVFT